MIEPGTGSSVWQRISRADTPHRVLRKVVIWCASFMLFFFILVVITPVLVKHQAERWLQDNGATGASIGNVDINPFTGRLLVADVNASTGDQARLTIDSVELDIRWWPLASRRAHVEGLYLSGAILDLELDNNNTWHIGGVMLAPAVVDSGREESSDTAANLWGMGSEFIRLANIQMTYKDMLTDLAIDVNEISLGQHFSWQGAADTEFAVDMTVNGAPLNISSNVAPWAEKRSFEGKIRLDDFNLARHSSLLEALAGISNITGNVDMNLDIGASISDQGVLEVSLGGPVSLADLGLNMNQLAIASQSVDWSGNVELRLPATDTEPLLQLAGGIEIRNTSVADPAFSVNNQAFDWQGSLVYASNSDNSNHLELDGTFDLTATNVELANFSLASQSTQWEGRLASDQSANDESAQTSAMGALKSNGIRTSLPVEELSVVMADIAWTGELQYTPATATNTAAINMLSALSAHGLSAAHAQLPFDLFTIAGLELTDVKVTGFEQASISQLDLQEARLLATRENATTADNTVLALEALAVSSINLAPGMALRLDKIQLVNPALKLMRNTRGDFVRIGRTLEAFSSPAEAGSEAEAETAADPESSPLQLEIGAISMQSDNLLGFQDRSVEPPASFRLAATALETGTVDTGGKVPTELSITTGNANMTLSATGSVNIFSDELLANLDIKLVALDLPPLSPYLPGFNIDRGRLSTDTTVMISGDQLNVQNALMVEGLTMNSKAAEGNDAAAAGMGMPVDVALDLLRDGNDRIILDIPVTGSLSDPQFGTADIIRVVVQRALQNAAMSFVTNALQPLGAILMVTNLAEKVSRPRFEPVRMQPGEYSLTPTDRDYLLKMADLLAKRPKLNISICSIATIADREVLLQIAMEKQSADQATLSQATDTNAETTPEPELPLISDQELLELAASRTSAVSDFLTRQAKTDRSRLFNCRDTIDTDSDAVARVTITL